MFNAEKDIDKWGQLLEAKNLPKITSEYKRSVTARLLENTQRAMNEDKQQLNEAPDGVATNAVNRFDPIVIPLIRRTTPQSIGFDLASVQPMSTPVGQIFAMKARYADNGGAADEGENYDLGGGTLGTEALYNEANTAWSGDKDSTHGANPSGLSASGSIGSIGDISGRGYTTSEGESLSTASGATNEFKEMGFTLEQSSIEARTRGLATSYTLEMAQDLKNMHGLDADSELINILQTEILAEQNRELIRTINMKAKLGAQGTTQTGAFDLAVDSDGRWAGENYKNLVFRLELEANTVATETRRGKANNIICSSNVASALAAAGYLTDTPMLNADLNVDSTSNLFAGVLNGRMKVFIDPYANVDYATVVYRGQSQYDAGLFYAPYVPLQLMRATNENTFQPKIGFKTRYGLKAHPFVTGATSNNGLGDNRANYYFRIFRVDNIQ